VRDPGLDRHEWETEWQGLESLVAESPALPEVDGLLERMLEAHSFPLTSSTRARGAQGEVVKEFLEARHVTRLGEAGEGVDPGDIGAVVAGYRNVYAHLSERYVA
jgi:hypothetical protein